MNKAELVEKAAQRAGVTKKEMAANLNALIETAKDALVDDGRIQLVGFGLFEVKTKAARTGINPNTFEPMEIPEQTVVSFKPGKGLKECVEKRNENR